MYLQWSYAMSYLINSESNLNYYYAWLLLLMTSFITFSIFIFRCSKNYLSSFLYRRFPCQHLYHLLWNLSTTGIFEWVGTYTCGGRISCWLTLPLFLLSVIKKIVVSLVSTNFICFGSFWTAVFFGWVRENIYCCCCCCCICWRWWRR